MTNSPYPQNIELNIVEVSLDHPDQGLLFIRHMHKSIGQMCKTGDKTVDMWIKRHYFVLNMTFMMSFWSKNLKYVSRENMQRRPWKHIFMLHAKQFKVFNVKN